MRVLVFLGFLPLAGCALFGGRDETVVGVGVAGCDGGGDALAEGFEDALAVEGCHWHIRAVRDDGGLLLTFDVPEFAAALDGEPASATYTFPDDAVRFTVETGCMLAAGVCDEDDSGFTPSVATTYTPTAGTVSVTLTPSGDESDATVVFTGVTLEDETGNSVPLDATISTRIYAE